MIFEILLTALCVLLILGLLFAWPRGFARRRPRKTFANAVVPGTVQTHAGIVPRKLEAALTSRRLIVRKGTDDDEILIGTAAAKPLGVVDDTGAIGDIVPVQLFGCAGETRIVTASEAITVDTDVYAAASGKVSKLSASAGTYYRVGRALTAAGADGDEIEIEPCAPVPVTVSE